MGADVAWVQRRRLALLLGTATLVPVAALIWLGLRVLQQDRDVERQRRRERLEVAAGRLALDIERRIQDIEEQLPSGAAIRLRPDGIEAIGNLRVLYQPLTTELSLPQLSQALAAAEVQEFQQRGPGAAAASYRRLAESNDQALRAAALVGLGRVLRQAGNRAAALDAYASLEQLGALTVAGQPAALVARQGRCKLFEETRDFEALRREVADLARVLYTGTWSIDRATFELYRGMIEVWGGPTVPLGAIERTEAAIQLWQTWRAGQLTGRGRQLMWRDESPLLVAWTGSPESPVVWVATAPELETLLRPLWVGQPLLVSASDPDGRRLFGTATASAVSLTPADTRLPFMLTVGFDGNLDRAAESTRRTLLIAGLVATLVLMLLAAYGLYRTTIRELRLARQQSDFVSAVSHEFRTPLTSMRHLTDLLVSRGVTSDERRTHYYELLAHETERLYRMVETLLSFGRIEAGAYAFHLEAVDARPLVEAIVGEFRVEPMARGRQIECEIEAGLPQIRADRDTLSRALWNLVDNAAKYSEEGSPIRVFARRQGDSVLMGVGDRGIGIPPGERDRIFEKFVRGSDAKRAGIRGVGIGLALVKRIAEAHGGSVQVESEPGRGSTFSLLLPEA